LPKYFHIETQARDGSWNRFTLEPSEGEELANKHLEEVQRIAREQGIDPLPTMRLREYTEEDRREDVLKTLTREERDNIVAEHIRNMGSAEFTKRYIEARDLNRVKTEFEKHLDETERTTP
jgi:hypothetical protein